VHSYRFDSSLLAALCLGLGLLACACTPEPESEPAPKSSAADESAAAQPSEAQIATRRGLWVLCQGSQRVLDDASRIPRLIEDARALGTTDLFVQVYRGGRAWFDSTLADPAPWQAAVAASGGVDPLHELIVQAHAAGMKVHAWVNVLNLADNKQAPLIEALGRQAVLVDQAGRSLLDYPKLDVPQPDRRYYRMGTPGVWLDVAAPGVAARLTETFAELLTRYPALDGLHLDYIRYPGVLPFAPGSRFGVGLDMGHGEATRARFRAETGVEAPRPPDRLGNANRWDRWRREQVTNLVRQIRDAAVLARPGVALSAAVWAHAERAYLSIGQDWRLWLDESLLEFAVPMAYTLDSRLLRYQAEAFAMTPQGPKTWIGLGSWLFAKRPAGALEQVAIAEHAGAAGVVLFSWDAIADSPALADALRGEAEASAEADAGLAPDADSDGD
jgi:uncharacterized lipoprotein YddW (UPF0748 family)